MAIVYSLANPNNEANHNEARQETAASKAKISSKIHLTNCHLRV